MLCNDSSNNGHHTDFPNALLFPIDPNRFPRTLEPPANLGWPMVAGRGRWSWSLVEVAEFRVIFNRSSIPS